MVKLQQQLAYNYKGKIKYKFVLNIPESLIKRLGWRKGEQLKLEVLENKYNRLVVSKENNG